MRHISLAAQFCLAVYAALVPLTVVVVQAGLISRKRLEVNTRRLVQVRKVKELAGSSLALLLTQETITQSILLNPDRMSEAPRKIDAYDHNLATFEEMRKLTRSPELLGLVHQLARMEEEQLRPADTAILERVGEGDFDGARRVYRERYDPARDAYEQLVRQLDKLAERVAAGTQREIEQANQNALYFVTIALLCGIALVGIVVLTVGRRMSRRLNGMVGILDAVSSGDLTQRLDSDSGDEVGRLGTRLNVTLERVGHTIAEIDGQSASLATASEELTDVSQQMGANAEETSMQAAGVAAAAGQVSRNVLTVATSTEEMTVSIREIARHACEAARIAENASVLARNTHGTVEKLGESGTEIGNVVKVISRVAEQTHMLALNATIEAARAGEAGQGFAVVAQEVKELARETARSSDDIRARINRMQEHTSDAVAAIREILSIIDQLDSISGTIAGAVEEQAATTNEISRNVAEAAQGSAQIAETMDSVAQVAGSTSEGAARAQLAATRLASMAGELTSLLSQFQYGGVSTAASPVPEEAQPPPPRKQPCTVSA